MHSILISRSNIKKQIMFFLTWFNKSNWTNNIRITLILLLNLNAQYNNRLLFQSKKHNLLKFVVWRSEKDFHQITQTYTFRQCSIHYFRLKNLFFHEALISKEKIIHSTNSTVGYSILIILCTVMKNIWFAGSNRSCPKFCRHRVYVFMDYVRICLSQLYEVCV